MFYEIEIFVVGMLNYFAKAKMTQVLDDNVNKRGSISVPCATICTISLSYDKVL